MARQLISSFQGSEVRGPDRRQRQSHETARRLHRNPINQRNEKLSRREENRSGPETGNSGKQKSGQAAVCRDSGRKQTGAEIRHGKEDFRLRLAATSQGQPGERDPEVLRPGDDLVGLQPAGVDRQDGQI